MGHEIDLKKYQIRTDLAIDSIDKSFNIEKEKYDDISVTTINLSKEDAEKIKKKEGLYITIEFTDVTDYNNKEKVKKIFSKELKKILSLKNINENSFGFIIGLGNSNSTPDSLGPLAIDKVITTKHLFDLKEIGDGFMKIATLKPSVTGQTGIETSDIIDSVSNKIKPDFLIVIDALASSSIERLNKTIQMTDTGIHPGSGIGNSRKEISFDTLNIPVIAIGIPTVVDAASIVSDTINYMYKHFSYMKKNINNPINKLTPFLNINYLKKDIDITKKEKKELMGMIGNLDDTETRQLIYEVLTPIGYNLMVTPKEIDFVIDKLSDVIGDGINKALHKNVE